jgi:hypothetical protein
MESQESTTQHHPSLGSESYHGTRGDSGSAASREAAQADYDNGVTNRLQLQILDAAIARGRRGVTAAEMREFTQEHHGRVSSAITKLHIAGKLVALTERRGHGGIYVTPEYVGGRETRPYKRQTKTVDAEAVVGVLLAHRRVSWGLCVCGWERGDGDVSHVRHQAQMIAEALS